MVAKPKVTIDHLSRKNSFVDWVKIVLSDGDLTNIGIRRDWP